MNVLETVVFFIDFISTVGPPLIKKRGWGWGGGMSGGGNVVAICQFQSGFGDQSVETSFTVGM